jgi:hypothetical protein
MPYVKQERRPALDRVVDRLVESGLVEGELTLFLLNLVDREHGGFADYLYRSKDMEKALYEAEVADVKPNGDINYILFKCCKYHIKPSYNNYKKFMSEIYEAAELCGLVALDYKYEFKESAEWIRIKLLTPYEEEKIVENGDV